MSSGDKEDLTRIEDLSEYIHENDDTSDDLLEDGSTDSQSETPPSFSDFSDDDTESNSFSTSDNDHSFSNNITDNFAANFNEESADDYDFDSPVSITQTNGTFEQDDTPLDSSEFNDTDSDINISSADASNTEATEDSFNSSSLNQFSQDDIQNMEEDETPAESEDMIKPSELPPHPPEAPEIVEEKKKPERFEDINQFANNISSGNIILGGNPPFALALKNIKFKEDANDILRILKEYHLLNNDNEQIYKQGIEHGSILISQISEYAAITLAHKFRRFAMDIEFGLSQEIHHSKSYDNDAKGLVSKHNLKQNKFETKDFKSNGPINPNSVILSTTATLQNYEIIKYLDLINVATTASDKEFKEFWSTQNSNEKSDLDKNKKDEYTMKLSDIYSHLASKLRIKAAAKGGNAVVGINYQTTPIISEINLNNEKNPTEYKISCSGNIVWVNGL